MSTNDLSQFWVQMALIAADGARIGFQKA